MTEWFFVSDLHGKKQRYDTLMDQISTRKPEVLLIGGDLFPSGLSSIIRDEPAHMSFLTDFLIPKFAKLKNTMGSEYPLVLLILGNDDGKSDESEIRDASRTGIWNYIHKQTIPASGFSITGYASVPPTPFLLKDWERYDVSIFVDPGCVSPEEGFHSIPIDEYDLKYRSIKDELAELTSGQSMSRSVFLFHSPPYQTRLDRAALDGKTIDGVPMDVHVGSIAIRKFIEARQPYLTLHGHIHESARLMGGFIDRIGRTILLGGAHDGPELALIRFDPEDPGNAVRDILG